MATQPGVKLTRVGPASADLLAGSLMDAIAGTCQERPGAGDLIPMDFDDEIFDVEDDVADGADQPDFRATVLRSGAVRLVYWGSWLLSSGPAYTLIAARDRAGVAIADLRVVRDNDEMANEVIVEFHSGGSDMHRAALCDWAQAVGYGRVWFDGEVVDLEPTARGPMATRCSGCGQQFIDGRNGRFWHHVRCSGAFPVACTLCGSDLPQWTPVRPANTSETNRNEPTQTRLAHAGTRIHRR